MAKQPDLDRLKSQLVTSGVQKQNPGLYQVIVQLIGSVKQLQEGFIIDIAAAGGGGTIPPDISDREYITFSDESTALPNSRELLAGNNVSFDDAVDNERTINVASPTPAGLQGYWSPLMDGDHVQAELITWFGDAIMVWTPTP